MAYFPAFIRFDNIDILIVGGGNIATKKLIHLLDFGSKIKIIAPFIDIKMEQLILKYNLTYEKREYITGDIKDFGIVIVAIDNIDLQKQIYNESKQYPKCLVNSVDSLECCDFIFSSYIKKDDLTIAISTNGSSPAFAKYLKEYLLKLIPNTIGDFLKQMKEYRTTMKKGKQRMEFLDKQAQQYIKTWGEK